MCIEVIAENCTSLYLDNSLSVETPVSQGCISSASLFSYSASDFIYDLRNPLSNDNEDCSKFEDILISRWEDAEKCNLLNYDLNCMYKLLEGEFNFSVQLNVERGEKRRKPMHFRALREPFSNLRWNFTKLKEDEILLYLQRKDHLLTSDTSDYHVVAVNASPLARGHSLLLPCINCCIPQVLSEVAVRLATDIMLLVRDSSFHVLFNSLLALASINHLHLHLLTWPYDSDLINRVSFCPTSLFLHILYFLSFVAPLKANVVYLLLYVSLLYIVSEVYHSRIRSLNPHIILSYVTKIYITLKYLVSIAIIS
ncbi:unnamed protein product [Wuchereria bancrofti]|uniref:GDPGP1-like N-terminal domain-containing protein n=1 Tax=Wuchereria bancrofti TaxID=6293 RepID=A0A3P7EPJ6_WUCBA|nr:unnamed protein product [Wuchereria bancrofti]